VVDTRLAREPVHERQLGGAGVTEHDRDAFLLEDLEKRLLAGDVCHGAQMISSQASVTKDAIEGSGGVPYDRAAHVSRHLGELRTRRRRVDRLRDRRRLPEPVRLDHHTHGRMGAPLTLKWAVDPEQGQLRRVRGYIYSRYGEVAEPVRILAQALDSSGAVVGQRIAWVPGG